MADVLAGFAGKVGYKNMRKHAAVLLVAAAVSAAAAVTSFAGEWKTEAGKYWYDTGSGYLANGIHAIEGLFYSFDPSGYMETGWQDEGGKWYYFDPASGAQVRGWLKLGDQWYYLDPLDGAMRTGIVEIVNKLYYFNPDGAMHAPGIFHSADGTKTYRASEDGSLYRNKADVDLENNYTVRYDENGVMSTVNEHSRLVAEAGGEKYREVMSEANAAERKEEDKALFREHAYELMGKLEENYIKRVVGRKGQVKTQRTKDWEAKVRRDLASFADESEISSFINDVEGRSYYKSSDGTYTTYYSEGYEDDSYDDSEDEEEDEE